MVAVRSFMAPESIKTFDMVTCLTGYAIYEPSGRR